MKPVVKKVLIGVGVTLGLVVGGGAIFVGVHASAFDESMKKVYDVPVPKVERSTDAAVLARGKHLVDAVAGCSSADCHGKDLSGGRLMKMGPLGTFAGPNITGAGMLAAYSDGELARMLRHGIKKDGRSLTFMPVQDFNWFSDADLLAIVSYVRTVPNVDKPNGPLQLGVLAKVLDRKGMLPLDVARKVASTKIEIAPPPAPTAEYGKFLARMCMGCHGETYSGGRIPGAPKELPVPLNITPDPSGIAGWTFDDFQKLMTKGARKNGSKLDPFMPIDNFGQMDETELKALHAFLMSLPPKAFGGR